MADTCSDYIYYEKGNSAIVLLSGHGAAKSKLLPGVPLRQGGDFSGFVTHSDRYTDQLTWQIAALLKQKGLSPFVIVAGVHRSQVDVNRPANEAYESLPAMRCYQYYHKKINEAVQLIKKNWGNGFLLDIHGQSRYDDDVIKGTRNKQTIHRLLEFYKQDVTEADDGFFYFLRNKGYSVAPQKNKKERYFYGGYSVRKYGSHHPSGIDAIQVELGRSIRIDEAKREQLAKDIAEAADRFYQRYYSLVQWKKVLPP